MSRGHGAPSPDERFRPRPFEVAVGMPLGLDELGEALPPAPGGGPRSALRDAVLPALLVPPCVVAFSGGRDSSAVLALATAVAREEGLPLPVALTMRFPGVAEADETQWQELVIGHVRPGEWVRLEFGDELDLLGPHARENLRRHGLLWPPNTHADRPLLERAAGGSFVDGVDGDSVFAWSHARAFALLRRQVRPSRRALRDLVLLAAPRPLRRRYLTRTGRAHPWLTPGAAREMIRRLAQEVASEPASYAARLDWFSRSRYVGAQQYSTALLAREARVALHRPLLDRGFLSALAHSTGRTGFRSRTAMMQALFGDLLPDTVVARATKASFPNYWGPESRHFAGDWDGTHVDRDLVDVGALRHAWLAPRPDARAALLLQAAWLAAQGVSPGSDSVGERR